MTTLTVWKFESADGARGALDVLQRLQKEELITINDAAYVYWPVDRKKPKTQQLHSLTGAGALAASRTLARARAIDSRCAVSCERRPTSVLRSWRSAMIFLPDSRAFCFANSKSPFVSWRAFLHSIIGSPVSSRSFMTIAAVISAMNSFLI